MKLISIVIFYILSDTQVITVHNIASIGQAALVCSLPLSTLWASAEPRTYRDVDSKPKLAFRLDSRESKEFHL